MSMRGHMQLLIVFLLLVMVSADVESARLYGAIYDRDLDSISNTVVHINTSPPQTHISRYGGYSFNIKEGSYLLVANLTLNNITRTIATQQVHIEDDGEYRIDLFIDEGLNISQEFTQQPPLPTQLPVTGTIIAALLLLMVVTVLAITVWYRRQMLPVHSRTQVRNSPDAGHVDTASPKDPMQRRVVEMLHKNGGSMAQKEIRRAIDCSQAKISMLLTEMENDGVIHRKTKGRSKVVSLA